MGGATVLGQLHVNDAAGDVNAHGPGRETGVCERSLPPPTSTCGAPQAAKVPVWAVYVAAPSGQTMSTGLLAIRFHGLVAGGALQAAAHLVAAAQLGHERGRAGDDEKRGGASHPPNPTRARAKPCNMICLYGSRVARHSKTKGFAP